MARPNPHRCGLLRAKNSFFFFSFLINHQIRYPEFHGAIRPTGTYTIEGESDHCRVLIELSN
jgi:hypothetical protein